MATRPGRWKRRPRHVSRDDVHEVGPFRRDMPGEQRAVLSGDEVALESISVAGGGEDDTPRRQPQVATEHAVEAGR
jgi:hypothetical protein